MGSADFGPESGLKLVINKEFQKQSDEEDSYNSMNFSMNNNGIMVQGKMIISQKSISKMKFKIKFICIIFAIR